MMAQKQHYLSLRCEAFEPSNRETHLANFIELKPRVRMKQIFAYLIASLRKCHLQTTVFIGTQYRSNGISVEGTMHLGGSIGKLFTLTSLNLNLK